MKSKVFKTLVLILCIGLALFAVSCKKTNKTSTSESKQGESLTESASDSASQGESLTESALDSASQGQENGLTFLTFKVEENSASERVNNAVYEFDFKTEIKVNGESNYVVSADKYGKEIYLTKTVPLNEGNNEVYVFETIDGEVVTTYAINIYRNITCKVEFRINDNYDIISEATVEEGKLIDEPQVPSLPVLKQVKWDYDFSKPITENTTIYLTWQEKEKLVNFKYEITETSYIITAVKDKGIANLNFPLGITEIGDRAFQDCKSLTSVTIPNSVVKIGSFAFKQCINMVDLVISDSVVTIEASAFYGCKNLSNITIGKGVKNIGGSAFYCEWQDERPQRTVYYNGGLEDWCNIEMRSSPLHRGGVLYINNVLLTEVILPSTVTALDTATFSYCSSLTSIKLHDNITAIGDNAFEGCINLVNVDMGNSVKSIGENAFWCCTSLVSITLSDALTEIGTQAFSYCSNLTSIVVGDALSLVSSRAFDECEQLTDVYYKGTYEEWNNIYFYVLNYYFENATRYYYVENEEDVPNDYRHYWHYVGGIPTAW